MALNMHHSLFLIRQFVSELNNYRLYVDVLHIEQLFYYRKCLFSMDARQDCQVTRMTPNAYYSVFVINHLCILKCITSKVLVIYGHSAYRTTALLSEIDLLWFWAAWEIWLKSYATRHILVVVWYKMVICILQVHTYIDYTTTDYNKTHIPYDCILQN